MSSVLGVTKDLMWNKFKLVNLILFFNVAVFAVILVSGILKSEWFYGEGILVGIACLVYFIGVILLVRDNESVISNNRYRLIPISEIKLYFSNLLTTCLAYAYLGILATLLFVGTSYLQMKSDIFVHFMIYTDMQLELFIEDAVITVLGIVLIWTGSTLVHLIVSCLSDVLAMNNQKFIKIIMNFLILILSVGVIFFTLTQMSIIGMNRYMNIPNNAFLRLCLFDAFGIVMSSVFNVYLLQNYFETRH